MNDKERVMKKTNGGKSRYKQEEKRGTRVGDSEEAKIEREEEEAAPEITRRSETKEERRR